MLRSIYRINKAGALSGLHLASENLDAPKSGEVQIQTTSIGLNFADIFAITGLYSATPSGAFIPGLEFSGTVVNVGEGVTRFKEGDRVMGVTRFGAYATSLNVSEAQITPIPESWSDAEGAAFLVQAFTAWYALFELGNLQPEHNVLVHSAAGGVGLHAIQMIHSVGANPIGCVGHSSKLEVLERYGVKDRLVRRRQFAKDLESVLNGRPLHLVLDGIGGDIQKASFDALAPTGRLVTFGAAQYTPQQNRPNWLKLAWLYLTRPRYDALAMVSDNKSVMGFNLIWLWENIGLFNSMLKAINAMQLPPPLIGKPFDFNQLPEALNYFKTGKSVGKVIVNVHAEG